MANPYKTPLRCPCIRIHFEHLKSIQKTKKKKIERFKSEMGEKLGAIKEIKVREIGLESNGVSKNSSSFTNQRVRGPAIWSNVE